MAASHSHVIVKDKAPQARPTITVGRIFSIVPDEEPETRFSRVNLEEDDEKFVEDAETKVVRGRRRPSPKASEVAEAK